MELTASQIRYLLTVYRLNSGGPVRSSDIARKLGVSRPSVHGMVEQLVRMGLAVREKKTCIRITDSGRALAERYDGGYTRISGFLRESLRLPSGAAAEGALYILSLLKADALEAVAAQPGTEGNA